MRLGAEVEVRRWEGEAAPILAAFQDEPFVDFGWLRSPLPARSATRELWGAQQGGRLVGVLVLDFAPDAWIEVTIAVRAELRRNGVGSLLLSLASRQATARDARLSALVDRSNVAARAFFAHHGFREEDTGLAGFVRQVG